MDAGETLPEGGFLSLLRCCPRCEGSAQPPGSLCCCWEAVGEAEWAGGQGEGEMCQTYGIPVCVCVYMFTHTRS